MIATDTPRQNGRSRVLTALTYACPDRVPVICHPSTAGLHVHGTALLDLLLALDPDNAVELKLPSPPAQGAVDGLGAYRELHTDTWGTTWEHRIYGIQGQPVGFPIATWAEAGRLQLPVLTPASADAVAAERTQREAMHPGKLTLRLWVSLFERLHAIRPMDEVLMAIADRDPDLLGLLDRLEHHWLTLIEREVALGADLIQFGDDWGSQQGPLISPSAFRELFLPRYRRLVDRVHARGARVLFHSCGRLGPILPILLELGIDVLWPQINVYDEDLLFNVCRASGAALLVQPDRQYLIPRGTPGAISENITRWAEHLQCGGGVIYVEIENDVPFANARAFLDGLLERR